MPVGLNPVRCVLDRGAGQVWFERAGWFPSALRGRGSSQTGPQAGCAPTECRWLQCRRAIESCSRTLRDLFTRLPTIDTQRARSDLR